MTLLPRLPPNSEQKSAVQPARKTFFPSLEALRGIAALWVALFHVAWNFPGRDSELIRNGYLWVDFFFVLSGFVISQSASDKIGSHHDLKRFMWLRMGRIYPLHVVMLSAFMLFELARFVVQSRGGQSDIPAFSVNSPGAFAVNLLLLHSFGFTKTLTFNGPSWSIAAEFWTYVVFALTVLFFQKRRVLAPFLVLAAAVGALAWVRPHDLDVTFDYGFLRCLVGFFLGVLLQRFHRAFPDRVLPAWVMPAMLAAALLFLGLKHRRPSDFVSPLLFTAVVGSVVFSRGGKTLQLLESKPLLWLGKVSYSIYMVHTLVLMGVAGLVKKGLHPEKRLDPDGNQVLLVSDAVGVAAVLVFVALLLVASHFSFKWIEDRFRKWAQDRAPAKRDLAPPA